LRQILVNAAFLSQITAVYWDIGLTLAVALPYTARPFVAVQITHGGNIRLAPGPAEVSGTQMAAACKAQAKTPVGKTLWRILGAAVIAVGGVVVLLALLTDGQARSALLGGIVGLLANVYAVWRVYASLVDASAERTLLNLYRAEFGKLVIIGALCALAFALIKDLAIAGFLTGLVTALLAATLGAITVQSSDT